MPEKTRPRKEDYPTNKKEQILDAAVEMFLEKDFYTVKMKEIAEQAGVGKGTLYEYFSSKEELFQESISYWMDNYLENFNSCLHLTASVKDSLAHLMKIHLEFLQEKSRWIRLLYNERPHNVYELGHQIIERRNRLMEGLAKLITRGIQTGELRDDIDVELASRTFLALNYVVMGGMSVLDGFHPEEEDLEALMDLFWKGVGNHETG